MQCRVSNDLAHLSIAFSTCNCFCYFSVQPMSMVPHPSSWLEVNNTSEGQSKCCLQMQRQHADPPISPTVREKKRERENQIEQESE